MKRTIILICFSFALCLAVKSEPITYTLSGTGSGTFGSDSFSNASFTITAIADTANIIETNVIGEIEDIYLVPNITTTISVFGLGTATFIGPTESADDTFGAFGIGTSDDDLSILDDRDLAFQNYHLSGSFGPVTGTATYNLGVDFSTSAGDFALMNVSYNLVTFQAEAAPDSARTPLYSPKNCKTPNKHGGFSYKSGLVYTFTYL